jgi:predicted tellurium resistance membrane protein TerC
VLLLNLKKKMMQMIDSIKYFCFSVLFFIGCGLVLSVIGIMWLIDQVIGKWEK